MDYRNICTVLTCVAYALAAVLIAPLLCAYLYAESAAAMLAALLASILVGLALHKKAGALKFVKLSLREGMLATVLAWLLVCLLGSLPYSFSGTLAPLDAIFESASGFTTTGATVISRPEGLAQHLLFWRTLSQWLGGMLTLGVFVVILPQLAPRSSYLFSGGVDSGIGHLLPRLKETSLALIAIYALLTIILTGCLVSMGFTRFDALTYAFATISTGGFTPHGNKVVYLDNPACEALLTLFMFLAGINYLLYFRLTQSNFKAFRESEEFKAYAALICGATLALSFSLVRGDVYGLSDALRHAAFQVISFTTTTGFVSADYNSWSGFAKLLLGFLLVVGGCAGSTSGGLKINRTLILIKAVNLELRRTMHPNTFFSLTWQGRILPDDYWAYLSRFFFIYIFVGALLTLGVTLAGVPWEYALFAVFSCISNLGPAFGPVSAEATYAGLAVIGKLALVLAMLLGRLEMMMVLVLLRREFWRKSRYW